MDRSSAEKDCHLEAQVSAEQKELFKLAAELKGQSLGDFVVASLQETARRTIEEIQPIRLDARESRAFAEAMLTPGEPSQRLRAAARRYLNIASRPGGA